MNADADLDDDRADELIAMSRSKRIEVLFGFEPFDWQRDALDDETPDKSINCGRQVGKSKIGGVVAVDLAFSGFGDVMIAGTAAANSDPTVLTRNVDEFERVEGIDIETY